MGGRSFGLFCAAVFFLLGILEGTTGALEKVECSPACLEKTLISQKSHRLMITGPAPEGAEIVVKILSPKRDFKLHKAGKGLGFVWLPVRQAEVRNLPGMCVVLSSASVTRILNPEAQKAAGLSTDFREISSGAQVTHKDDLTHRETADLNREFVSGLIGLLKRARLYQFQEGVVKISGKKFVAELTTPPEAPLGEYRVLCYAVKGGEARLFGEETFSVKSTGIAEWLSRQAHQSSGVYGFLAAFMAVAVGLFVGVIFKKGGGH